MTDFERRCLEMAGEDKEIVKRLVNNGGLNYNHEIDRIIWYLKHIKEYRELARKEQKDNATLEFYEPSEEYVRHTIQKERRRNSIVRKRKSHK